MGSITLTTIITVAISMAFQVTGILLLPASKGFSNLLPAAGVVTSFGVALLSVACVLIGVAGRVGGAGRQRHPLNPRTDT